MNLLKNSTVIVLIAGLSKYCFASDSLNEDKTKIHWTRLAFTSALALGVSVYAVDYEMETWGKVRGKFHFKDDWDGDYLKQSDEMSHLFYGYKMTQLLYIISRFNGFSKRTSVWIGSVIAFLWLFSVEYPIDAYNPQQGFGVSDLIFNTVGVAVGAIRLCYPRFSFFDFKISFEDNPFKRKSIIAKKADEYDNMIYWLTFTPNRPKNPFNISIGYSTYRPRWRVVKRELYFSVGTSLSDLTYVFLKNAKPLFDFLGFCQFSIVKNVEKEKYP